MNKIELVKIAAAKALGRNGLILKKYSPEILISIGIAGILTSTVLACKATLKVEKVLIDGEDRVSDIKWTMGPERNDGVEVVGYKKELAKAKVRTGVELVKLYGPSVVLGTVSIACIVGSHNIMQSRNLALVAAYNTIQEGFNNYRRQVVEEFGEDKDRQYKFGITEETVTEVEKDENGKSKKVKKVIETSDPTKHSQYARFFDESNPNWTANAEYNLAFLRSIQNFANDRLRINGHLFLNDVYDMLGYDHTSPGQVVGWVMDKNDGKDHFIDFGIYDMNNPRARMFVNGAERSILLDFNVDGVVFDKI